jgi:catechol-2,3-dioxygenase
MSRPVINAVAHVALVVTDLEAAVHNATTIMGLRVSERREDSVYLTEGAPHHSIQYIAGDVDALHHIGLVAPDSAALDEIRQRAETAGARILQDTPFDDMVAEGFVLIGPEDFAFEIYRGMPQDQPRYTPTGVKPTRFGHVNINATDAAAMRDFFAEVLDFKVSDAVVGAFLMRCNVDHHGMAIFPGERAQLHHHAWEVQSTQELGQLGDRLDEVGQSLRWGPVRHGAGNNIAAYYTEPSGVVVEYYCDLLKIYDDESYEVPVWDETDHKWFSKWAPLMPEGFAELGVPRLVFDSPTAEVG